MTGASHDPTPFRRFPWVQLVFCLACLTMTAWTWMRYSYCWRITRTELADGCRGGHEKAFLDYWCVVEGQTNIRGWGKSDDGEECLLPVGDNDDWGEYSNELVVVNPRRTSGVHVIAVGRLVPLDAERASPWAYDRYGGPALKVDCTRSRLHGASVAGLVAGSMGCFIFGLYLLRWLRERKAAA